jgi:hypothetical protein
VEEGRADALGRKQLTLHLWSAQDRSSRARPLPSRAQRRRRPDLRHARRANQHRSAPRRPGQGGHRFRTCRRRRLAGRYFRQPGKEGQVNVQAVRAIYRFEMARTRRTLMQASSRPSFRPPCTRGLRRGDRLAHRQVEGISYGASSSGPDLAAHLTQSISNASFGIYFPKLRGRSTSSCRRPFPSKSS